MDLTTPTGVFNTLDITASTNVRDVSEMLELWAHKDTPFLNRISWGEESGGLSIEWLHEHLGYRYFVTSGAIGTGATSILVTALSTDVTSTEVLKAIHPGTLLYADGVADSGDTSGDQTWLIVSSIASTGTIDVAFASTAVQASVAAAAKVYIVGSFANEGSTPDRDVSRKRFLLSNNFAILRKDIRLTGSHMATDYHAVANELQHQIKMRLLELQMEREMSILFSYGNAKSSSAAPYFQGFVELMVAQSANTFSDIATSSLTETSFNNTVADCADNGGSPNVVVGSYTQIRKFTGWSTDRIRTQVDKRLGGGYITQYLTDTGITVDLLPLQKFPPNILAVIDTEKLKLRAKKGRKLLMEQLGIVGDYREWQILSEYSLEHHGIADGMHACYFNLA